MSQIDYSTSLFIHVFYFIQRNLQKNWLVWADLVGHQRILRYTFMIWVKLDCFESRIKSGQRRNPRPRTFWMFVELVTDSRNINNSYKLILYPYSFMWFTLRYGNSIALWFVLLASFPLSLQSFLNCQQNPDFV